METEERWLDIKGYEGRYQVSSLGRVKRVKAGKNAPAGMLYLASRSGYPIVSLRGSKGHRGGVYYVHTLVAEAFIGPRPRGRIIHHKDGNRANARLDNLEYMRRGKHVRHHHIESLLELEPIGPGGGLTMFD